MVTKAILIPIENTDQEFCVWGSCGVNCLKSVAQQAQQALQTIFTNTKLKSQKDSEVQTISNIPENKAGQRLPDKQRPKNA
eukprot:994759-Amphidinium_carterae.1